MKAVLEMMLYMYLYQSKVLQMAAPFRAYFVILANSIFGINGTAIVKLEGLETGCWDNVCLCIVRSFVCLSFVYEIPYFAERRGFMLAPILQNACTHICPYFF